MTGLGTGIKLTDLLAVGAAGIQLAPLIQQPAGAVTEQQLADVAISNLTLDSRQVTAGSLFFARAGVNHRGCDFILSAQQNGAAAVVLAADEWQAGFAGQDQLVLPVFITDDLDEATGQLAAAFYAQPGKKLKVVGVTGTNGKTSCAHYIAQGLNRCGEVTALIGTVGNGLLDNLQTATHTTPDAISLQALLADFVRQGATAVVMEVSSHALDQKRVAGVDFDLAAFTNLSRDHLDYHGDMAGYFAAKARFFTDMQVPSQVINADDSYGKKLLGLACGQSVQAFAETDSSAGVHVLSSELSIAGMQADVATPWGVVKIHSQLVGKFNLSNLLLTIAALGELGVEAEQISDAVSHIHAVPGRMQAVRAGQPLVLVDYAHTPDALEKALQALAYREGQLVCVFGCGGDRDTGKRPQMARVAESLADVLVITSDNPRSEEPEQIIDMVVAGLKPETGYVRLADRKAAINQAVQQLAANDILLIAGKGHEDYQEVHGIRLPFDDVSVACEALQARDDLQEARL